MTRLKQKSPEQFIGSSSVGERIAGDVFKRHLAEGACGAGEWRDPGV